MFIFLFSYLLTLLILLNLSIELLAIVHHHQNLLNMKIYILSLFAFVAYSSCKVTDTSKRLQKIFNNKIFLFDDLENTISHPYTEFIVTGYSNKTIHSSYQKNTKDYENYHDNDTRFSNVVTTEKVDSYKNEINEIYPKMLNSNFLQTLKNGVETLYDEDIYMPEFKKFHYRFKGYLEIPSKFYDKDISYISHRIFGYFCVTKYVSGKRNQLVCDYLEYRVQDTLDGKTLNIME
ncbi:uncharacterized protein LOC126907758 [Daktulosphaira vitifoliae]|uniref:uncharacterized protein LOC126907758 n=1 Tax=Daktulosphaira vitifoliae TaxID=58002 RepID=UPI0021AAF3FC|nr:uncharacterized protein LOC126907758 [Daktulosphaira vitifoliae]